MPWQETLSAIRAASVELARVDPAYAPPQALPRGASPAAIAAAERRIGRRLPPSYRELLALHDGVPRLYHGLDLLDSRHLARGTYVDVAKRVIDLGEPRPWEGTAWWLSTSGGLVPFGIDTETRTILAWDLDRPRRGGELEVVVWVSDIGERVDGLSGALTLIHDMLRGDIDERLRSRNGATPASASDADHVAPQRRPAVREPSSRQQPIARIRLERRLRVA